MLFTTRSHALTACKLACIYFKHALPVFTYIVTHVRYLYIVVIYSQHCRVGQTVRIISDLSQLHKLQRERGIWNDDVAIVSVCLQY